MSHFGVNLNHFGANSDLSSEIIYQSPEVTKDHLWNITQGSHQAQAEVSAFVPHPTKLAQNRKNFWSFMISYCFFKWSLILTTPIFSYLIFVGLNLRLLSNLSMCW